MIDPTDFIDGTSLAIVAGGTVAATFLRCGIGDSVTTFRAILGLFRRRFSAATAQGALAASVGDMRRDGIIRAQFHRSGDPELDEATNLLFRSRSLDALRLAHVSQKRRRGGINRSAVRTLDQAAELSPVFGLAGTLVSLTQLPAGQSAPGGYSSAISMAVLTTLYGLLLGNMVFAPVARIVARRNVEDERERQKVLDWLEVQAVDALPRMAVSSQNDRHECVR